MGVGAVGIGEVLRERHRGDPGDAIFRRSLRRKKIRGLRSRRIRGTKRRKMRRLGRSRRIMLGIRMRSRRRWRKSKRIRRKKRLMIGQLSHKVSQQEEEGGVPIKVYRKKMLSLKYLKQITIMMIKKSRLNKKYNKRTHQTG